jgi:hypothetical protein
MAATTDVVTTDVETKAAIAYIRSQWLELPVEERRALAQALRVVLDSLAPSPAIPTPASPAPTKPRRMSAAALHHLLVAGAKARAPQRARRS